MPRIDELDNDQLAGVMDAYGYGDLAGELDRVETVISSHAVTGADLELWITRSRMLEQEMETRETDPRRDD